MAETRGNKWALPVGALGALGLIAAAIMHWAVLPANKKLPDDTDVTRQLDGTARTLLNPAALASGDLTNALQRNVPIQATRSVKALATDGNVAEVEDIRVLSAGGQEVGRSDAKYAVDRKSLEAASKRPDNWPVVDHKGLTVSWPIGAKKQDYSGWVNETKSTVPLKYAGEEKRGGLNTYKYTAESQPAPLTDETTLATLPRAIPAAALKALVPTLGLPDTVTAGLGQLLPTLGDPVPLGYQYQVKSTYWVEPTTGIVVDTERDEIRNATLAASGATVASLPVYDVTTKFTGPAVAAAAKEAQDKRNTIKTVGTTVPGWLTGTGAAALLAGLAGTFLRRRPTPAPVRVSQDTPDVITRSKERVGDVRDASEPVKPAERASDAVGNTDDVRRFAGDGQDEIKGQANKLANPSPPSTERRGGGGTFKKSDDK